VITHEKALDIVTDAVLASETLACRWIVNDGIRRKQRNGGVGVEGIGGGQQGDDQRLEILRCGSSSCYPCCQAL